MNKNKSKEKEVNELINIAIEILGANKEYKLVDKSPRQADSIWNKICKKYNSKKCSFTEAMRIRDLWLNNSHNFSSIINQKLKILKHENVNNLQNVNQFLF